MTFIASLLYEDRAAPNEGGKLFAPHQLVLACVADRLALRGSAAPAVHELRGLFKHVSRNGRDNLLKDCVGDRWQKFSPRGQPVFAFVDYDRIHDVKAWGLERGACFTMIRRAFREKVQPDEKVTLVLLRDNLESVFEASREANLLGPERRPELDRLIAKSGANLLVLRDSIITSLAFAPDRQVRDTLTARVSSLGYLADRLASLVPA